MYSIIVDISRFVSSVWKECRLAFFFCVITYLPVANIPLFFRPLSAVRRIVRRLLWCYMDASRKKAMRSFAWQLDCGGLRMMFHAAVSSEEAGKQS